MNQASLFSYDLPTLYARSKTGAVLTWEIEIEGEKYRMVTGQESGAKVSSAWSVASAKNVGQANETTAEQQAYAEALSKWKKKLKSGGYWEDVKDIDKEMTFIEPMLAHPLYSKKTKKDKKTGKPYTEVEDRTDKLRWPVMVDRKYNGMRQVTSVRGPFSRKGEEVKTAPHIFDAVSPLFETHTDLVLDGELYNHDWRHKLNELIKIVRTNAVHKITEELLARSEKIVRYYVYDGYGFTVNGKTITEQTPCRERRDALKILLKDIPYVVVVPYFMVTTMSEAKDLYGGFIDDGYEGAILRNADAAYQHYRTDDLIKLKPFDDMEVVIIDVIDPGSGNWGGTGKTASVRMSNGKVFTATFKGSRETLTEILKNKTEWINQKVTITYNGFTGLGTPSHAQIDPNNCLCGDR